MQNQKVLTQMLDQFQAKHNRLPDKIVIAPVALAVLGLKKSLAPNWNGIPVECRLFDVKEAIRRKEKKVRALGVFVKEHRGRFRVVSCDLSS